MDLKVDKIMVKSEFDHLIQKLALKMWNDCSKVFTKERQNELKSLAKNQSGNQKNSSLSKVEMEACKNIFVLTDC